MIPGFQIIGGDGFAANSSGGGDYLLQTYTNAVFAYSTRDLNGNDPDIALIRRSSDSSELAFKANEITDGTLTAWVGSGDGFVVELYDQSGNGYTASQTTPSDQPKIVISGSVVTTTSGIIGIKGGNLDSTPVLLLSSIEPEFYFVAESATDNSYYPYHVYHNRTHFGYNGSSYLTVFYNYRIVKPITPNTDYIVGIYQDSAGNVKSAFNTTTLTTETSYGTIQATTFDPIVTGPNFPICEIVLFDRGAGTSQIESIIGDVNDHYGCF
jgi:hypothetical protein